MPSLMLCISHEDVYGLLQRHLVIRCSNKSLLAEHPKTFRQGLGSVWPRGRSKYLRQIAQTLFLQLEKPSDFVFPGWMEACAKPCCRCVICGTESSSKLVCRDGPLGKCTSSWQLISPSPLAHLLDYHPPRLSGITNRCKIWSATTSSRRNGCLLHSMLREFDSRKSMP